MATLIQIQLRRDIKANWLAADPVLKAAEPAIETDTGKLKIGDGVTAYSALAYFNDQSEELTLTAGENINADRAIVNVGGQAFYLDPTNSAHLGKAIGVSRNSVLLGQSVNVLTNEQVNTGLVLTAGAAYYSGAAGVLQTTPPASGVIQQIGTALTTSKLLINLDKPILKL